MLNYQTLISVTEVLLVTVPTLLIIAFITIAERKTMGSMQRILGPNVTGFFGLLQAFADALKLLLKEYVGPMQANQILFFIGPIIILIFSLLGYAVIPYGPGLTIGDLCLGVLYMLAVSLLSTYGILLAEWYANYDLANEHIQPCVVTSQRNVSFLAGLCLIIYTAEYSEWLTGLINSLFNDFSIQYCLNMLKDIENINQKQNQSTIFPLLNSVSFIFPVWDLTSYTNLFTEVFLSRHASLHGENFNSDYYRLLSDFLELYEDLYGINTQLHLAYDDLMEYFSSELQADFLTAYFATNGFTGDFEQSAGYLSRLETFNAIFEYFLDRYNAYRNAITTVFTYLQQIQGINPRFDLSLPSFDPIRVAPVHWLIVNFIEPNFVWDPVIFVFDNISPQLMRHWYALAETLRVLPIPIIQNILISYYQTRQILSSLPFNSFANSNTINLFEIELEERRSRARTRRETRDVASSSTMIRTRSRTRSASPTRSRSRSRTRTRTRTRTRNRTRSPDQNLYD